jgi:PAS domain S-box-containing protein
MGLGAALMGKSLSSIKKINTMRILLYHEPQDDCSDIISVINVQYPKASFEHVTELKSFLPLFRKISPKCIICVYSNITPESMIALELAHTDDRDIPLLLICDELDIEEMVDAIHKGAANIVLRSGLHRLCPAMEKAHISMKKEEDAISISGSLAISSSGCDSSEGLAEKLEKSSAIISILDKRGYFQYINPTFQRVLGWSKEMILGTSAFSFIHPDDLKHAKERFQAVLEWDQVSVVTRLRYMSRSGEWRCLDIIGNNMTFHDQIKGIVCISRDVTDQVQTEEQIKILSRAVEQSPSSIIVTNSDGIIEFVNPRFCRVTGYALDEVIGQKPSILKSEHTTLDEYRRMWETIQSGQVWRGEFCNRKKDGSLYWEKASISSIKNEQNQITHYVAVKHDITENKKTEENLQRAHRTLQTIISISPLPIIAAKKDGAVTLWNKAAERLFGWSEEEVLGHRLPYFNTTMEDEFSHYFSLALSGIPQAGVETSRIRRDGSSIDVHIYKTSIPVEPGEEPEVLAIVVDITSMKKAQDQLRLSEETNRTIINSLSSNIAVLDKDGVIIQVNDAWNSFAEINSDEYTRDTGVGTNYLAICRKAAAEGCEEATDVVLALQAMLDGSLGHYSMEYPCHSPNHRRWFMMQATPLAGGTGGVVITHTNITERKLAEEATQKAYQEALNARMEIERINQQLEITLTRTNELVTELEWRQYEHGVLLSSIPSILVSINAENEITGWSAAAEQLMGMSAANAAGKYLQDVQAAWDVAIIQQSIEQCKASGEPVKREDTICTLPDGERRFLSFTITPMRDAEGNTHGMLLLGADTTERKQLVTQLAQAQRLESMGELAAGIAHEINTPTQYIGDNVRFLEDAFQGIEMVCKEYRSLDFEQITPETIAKLRAVEEEADIDYTLKEIPSAIAQSLDGVERVSKIVKAMKEFSHPGSQEKVPLDLKHAIESTLTVARNEWKYVAEVETNFDPALPPVPCLPGEFNQMILNLVINAAHAIKDVVGNGGQKGRITVTTKLDGVWAEIRIKDTGTGIPENVRNKVFNPFFTTKEVGKGSGQGLAIARSVVVDKHGGNITFETCSGEGTTFIVRLPFNTAIQELPDKL